MQKEKYNIIWQSYSDHLRDMLHEMMKSNELTDVTLVCDDKKQFKAHKIVLSACSTVFKNIITSKLSNNTSVIYLRGIQHQEMESILEFMYLGVATLHQERMKEFLNVAKNLEIKELSKVVEFDGENEIKEETEISGSENNTELISEQQTTSEEEQKKRKKISDSQSLKKLISQIPYRNIEGMLNCDQCEGQFTNIRNLNRHVQSKHKGVKYACNQCDHEATQPQNLKIHIKSQHEGVKFTCNQCEYQATQQSHLTFHINSKHEGVKFDCSSCDYKGTRQALYKHKQSKH